MSPIPIHRLPTGGRGAVALAALLLALLLPLSPWGPIVQASAPLPPLPLYRATVQSHAVHFGLSGFEPDFDPLYRLVLVATLHDRRPAPVALPDATLVLGAYLENFQLGTTPVLPDLLSPDRVAQHLDGFVQGKAALVTMNGRVGYTGSLLGEVMQGTQLHLVVTLDRVGAAESVPSLRLMGALTLATNGTQHGTLESGVAPDRAVLAIALPVRARALDWRAIVNGLGVTLPPMRGAGSGGRVGKPSAPARVAPFAVAAVRPTAAPGAPVRSRATAGSRALWGDGVALLSLGGLVLLWRTRRGRHGVALPALPDEERPVTALGHDRIAAPHV